MGYRVLLAEDEWLVAVTLRIQLESLGHEVVGIAGTGLDAVRMAQALQPDLVLMDVQMPGLDGLGATHQLMRESPTCVVIVTGKAGLAAEAEAAGAVGYVVKPFGLPQISTVLDAARRRFESRARPRASRRRPTPASA